ncbi:MAG: DUF4159 domain-containing protein [Planctomycetota bacterium]|nr:DUF4159 domain-containing protein [Planctomycetota bacterium]
MNRTRSRNEDSDCRIYDFHAFELKEANSILWCLLRLFTFTTALVAVCPCAFPQDSDLDLKNYDPDKLTFVRIMYDSVGGNGEAFYRGDAGWIPRWATDHPVAAKNLTFRLNQLTTIQANQGTLLLRLTDERLFQHPFVFMSDPGWQVLTRSEQKALKKYLDNGGFLWADDFWGQAEWDNFENNMKSVAPKWKWFDIPNDHPILSTVYPLKKCPQVTAIQFYRHNGVSYDPAWIHKRPNGGDDDMAQVHFRGLSDDNGRLVAVATHNTDIADGWEREGDDEEFFQRFSIDAYALAINILSYVMSH